jgi:hypothetical protein
MQILPNFDNSSERLNETKANTGYAEFIRNFALQLRTEREEITKSVKSMEKAMMSRVVDNWAQPSDIIGKSAGVYSSLSADELKQAYENMKDDSPSILGTSELGDLKSFDAEETIKYLDELNNDEIEVPEMNVDQLSDGTDPLAQVRDLVGGLALENPISDDRFNPGNSLAA